MKTCPTCGQQLAEVVSRCPNCSTECGPGRGHIGDYRLIALIHENPASLFYKAKYRDTDPPVLIRLFKPEAGLDEQIAGRLRQEIERRRERTSDRLIRHLALERTSTDEWYQVSEWVDAVRWDNLIAQGYFQDRAQAFALFVDMARALEELHQREYFIPRLIKEDFLLVRQDSGGLAVRLDHKLSRFLDPTDPRPTPELRGLLDCHPDVLGDRPLGPASETWSLGRLFAELLAGSHEGCDHHALVSGLELPPKARLLLHRMLHDNPAQRPSNVATIVETLSEIARVESEPAAVGRLDAAHARVSRLRHWVFGLAGGFAFFILLGIALQLGYGVFSHDSERQMQRQAARLKNSVALIVTHYWLDAQGKRLFDVTSAGSAFLVDREGYLVTNRHVAAPWWNNTDFRYKLSELGQSGIAANFGHEQYLWFDNAKALYSNRNPLDNPRTGDLYRLETAYRNDGGKLRVELVTAIPPPLSPLEQHNAVLDDDVAILKVSPVPAGLPPLLLAAPEKNPLQPLENVATLGFPHGAIHMPDERIQASVTKGSVRRVFDHVIQIDASLHPGNSGGPVIDQDGKVIGIASAIATHGESQILPDFGMVLPIEMAQELLEDVKRGHVTWDPIPDPGLPIQKGQMLSHARNGRWDKAVVLAETLGVNAVDADNLVSAAVVLFCNGKTDTARALLEGSLLSSRETGYARWLLTLIDWKGGRADQSEHFQTLLTEHWASNGAVYRHLAAMLEKPFDARQLLSGAGDRKQRTAIRYIQALLALRNRQPEMAERALQAALIESSENELDFLLVRSELERLQERRLLALAASPIFKQAYRKETEAFWEQYESRVRPKKRDRAEDVANLLTEFPADLRPDQLESALDVLLRLLESDPLWRMPMVNIASIHATQGEWSDALNWVRRYLSKAGFEDDNRLGMSLLYGQLLVLANHPKEGGDALAAFAANTHNDWFRDVALLLLGKKQAAELASRAAEHPAQWLILHVALGLHGEAEGDLADAIRHYRLALESQMTHWVEYGFARNRIEILRWESE